MLLLCGYANEGSDRETKGSVCNTQRDFSTTNLGRKSAYYTRVNTVSISHRRFYTDLKVQIPVIPNTFEQFKRLLQPVLQEKTNGVECNKQKCQQVYSFVHGSW